MKSKQERIVCAAIWHEERFQEMATCWSVYRKEILSELDEENEDENKCSEFDYVDKFYGAIWSLRDFSKGNQIFCYKRLKELNRILRAWKLYEKGLWKE